MVILIPQVALTFNGERNSTVVWTDPLLPEDSARNASFRLCDNNFHEVLLHKESNKVTLSVDGHNVTSSAVQENFFLSDGKFYIGGVPGKSDQLQSLSSFRITSVLGLSGWCDANLSPMWLECDECKVAWLPCGFEICLQVTDQQFLSKALKLSSPPLYTHYHHLPNHQCWTNIDQYKTKGVGGLGRGR